MSSPQQSNKPDHYTIRIQGHLAANWSEWFADMAISYTPQETILAGPIMDQAALHGLLARVRDLNLVLISVVRGTAEPPNEEWIERTEKTYRHEEGGAQ